MERPLELLAIIAVVGIGGLSLLRGGSGSLRRQAVAAGAIGLASAAVISSQLGDLIPDGLEPPLALLGVGVMGIVMMACFRRPRPTVGEDES